jgi:hypothetical protein
MMPRPHDRLRLPGHRLREVARKFCSPATLEHVVDPILADLQHELDHARPRSAVARARVRLTGYVAFGKALTLHAVLAGGAHLAHNAFGATPEERAFHRRAGLGTLGALAASTSIVALYGIGTTTRSLVYMFTHLRWPGPPSVADVLPAALEIAANPRGLLLLLPCLMVMTLSPSLLLGVFLGVRRAGAVPPPSLRPFLRQVAGVSLALTLATFALTGWVVPDLGTRYREFLTASIFNRPDSSRDPTREVYEVSFPALEARAHAEAAAGRIDSSRRYRVEWHRRLAWAAASLVFGLLGLALAAGPRAWTNRQVAAMTLAATVLYYWGLTHVSARALDVAPSSPFLVVWSIDIAIALVAAALLLRAYGRAKSPSVAV